MKTVKNINYNTLISAIVLFLTLYPYFVWNFNSYLEPIMSILIGFVFYSKRDMLSEGGSYKKLLVFFFVIISFYLLTGDATFFGVIVSFSILYIPFGRKNYMQELLKYFATIYSVVVGLALISWVLFLMNKINPTGTITPLNTNDFDYYTTYPLFMIVSNSNGLWGSFRFSGPFDESGVIGSISAVLLCMEGFNFKQWRTYIYLLSGVFSLSMFFFLAVFVYGVVHFILVKKSSKNLILFLALFAGLYFFTKDDPLISHSLWNRFEWNSAEGKLAGEDRMTEEADRFYETKRGSMEYWFGLQDYDSYWKIARGGSSYKNVVMKNGMVFFLLYISFFLLIAWKNKQSWASFALFAFLYLAMIYQRPYLFQSAWIFLFSVFARGNLVKQQNNIEHV